MTAKSMLSKEDRRVLNTKFKVTPAQNTEFEKEKKGDRIK